MMKIQQKLSAVKSALSERREVRKRLRGPAELRYAIADSIGMLDAPAWKGLTGQSGFFLSYGYLRALEAVLPSNLTPRYALVYDGDRPVAAIYMQLADIKLAQASKASLGPLGESLGQRILTCGNLLTFGQHGLAFAQGVDPELAWHGVAEVLYRVRQAEKLAGSANFVMIKDLHGPQVEDASFLKNLSYRFVETEPNMVLALAADWKSYDDYLASLASKYRANIRNGVFKPIEQAQCTVEHFTDMAGMQAEVHALYKEVQVNAGFRPFELQPEYFPALQEAAGERFRCSVVKREGKMLGFLVTIADGETAIAFHIGFDRAAAADLPIYLRLLHAGIADAIGLGCKRISFGRTALEPKAALGARPETFGVLIRHRQPLMNKVIKHLLLNIDHDEAPDRSPFKKTEGKAA
jgi:predicted N-acyltransferase